ncbi:Mucin-associated surface protein (MASP) [Trypanosoma cruzi]|uniref:Mucin-associated surface protein (MASP), putative n=2 Tax=Trypanosoma cruzi TaxID=5693 RepID=Q4E1H3_TRYCC|nr:mucin-associated surface protein (MASP), putative [Trypanosoma cruzi]EAN98646.1 mucin-associated surface protein (MASP), putative [Trypanosoma cruzi]PWV17036.1 Mucin-associated surface protein (MASP) [Trypanosoma cruzi]RNC56262.1 mucin-associated surface protein (MASP) [Trypanosoma cruzi]|eukprot:XP_820497.1 mucin-associated surface protein (MASP) [Trypanosoma cruzi strain CL Brener]
MAMMMAGRVLLVYALCVLWCGTPGGRCDEDELPQASLVGASGSDGKSSLEPPIIAQGGSPNSVLESISVKETRAETDEGRLSTEEEEEDEDENEGIPQPPSPPPPKNDEKLEKVNESEPQPENQRQVEGGTQNQSEKETETNGQEEVTKKKEEESELKPQDNQTPVQEEDTRNVGGHQPSQGKDQQIKVEAKTPSNPAGDYSPGEHNGNDGSNEKEEEEGEEGVEGHERHRAQEREEAAHVSGAPEVNSTDIQQEVQRTHAGETPTGIKQKAGEERDDETEEEREEQKGENQENPPGKEKETITGANATNQINTTPGDSDGSTAVSHTTSPLLLLLLVVACAAAAAVVAA